MIFTAARATSPSLNRKKKGEKMTSRRIALNPLTVLLALCVSQFCAGSCQWQCVREVSSR